LKTLITKELLQTILQIFITNIIFILENTVMALYVTA